ncbi:MAG: DUF3494 domain-containing protein [Gemmatimonadales bacterium]|nr:MAG: DUF3494 domain-containing protein [Gemmatimonadales bacterium]
MKDTQRLRRVHVKIPSMTRTPGALRPPFPAIRWIVAAALMTVTAVACDVHSPVGPGEIASMTLTPAQTTMGISSTQQLVARAFDAEGKEISISGSGANSSAQWDMVNGGGTVDGAGMFRAGTAIGTFTNTVRVSMGGKEAFASFTVVAGPAAAIVVTPNPDSVGVGMTRQFVATAVDAGGNPVPVTPTWTVVSGGGTINSSSGMFTAGTTAGTFSNTVRASSGSLSGFATVTVRPGPSVSLAVSPNPHAMPANGVQQFTAMAMDASGNTSPVTATWTVVNGGGAINSASGVFTAGTAAGTFTGTVRAASGSLSGTATVTVIGAPAVTITVTPNPVTLGTRGTQQFNATAVDALGNAVAISPVWSVVHGGGSINASSGMFTAGDSTGTFVNTVRATSGSLSGTATVNVTTSSSPPPPPPPGIFGSAAPNGIMAGTQVTCITNGLISADVSISPGSTITGYPPCVITGTRNLANALAAQMQMDLTKAYNTLAGLPCPPANAIVADLGGTTKPAGVYCSATGIGVTGTLTLDGGGNPNAEFVFQAGSSLTTAGNIVLINEAQAKNVYWQVGSSATIGTASKWQGNIVALTSITLVDTATLIGRALARNGAVSLGTSNTITLP